MGEDKSPANHAMVIIDPQHPEAGKGGVVPPAHTRWVPGQSGNPAGRPSYGAAVVEYINELHDTPEEELERIARDRALPPVKREAAISILTRLADAYDLADFEGLVSKGVTLSQLRDQGVPVRRLKKLTDRTSKSGSTREIELTERGDRAIDRILDRTLGKPGQPIAVATYDRSGDAALRARLERLTDEELAEYERRLRAAMEVLGE